MGVELVLVDKANKRTFLARDSSFGFNDLRLKMGSGINTPFRKYKDFSVLACEGIIDRTNVFKYTNFSKIEAFYPLFISRIANKGYKKYLDSNKVEYEHLFEHISGQRYRFYIAKNDECYFYKQGDLFEVPFADVNAENTTLNKLAYAILLEQFSVYPEDPIKSIYETYKSIAKRNIFVDFPIYITSTDSEFFFEIDECFNMQKHKNLEAN